jgi:arabinose-5-phosphate isomerase
MSITQKQSSLQLLFEEQRRLIESFYDNLDIAAAEQCFAACQNCMGMIILTGVGKSGIIAEKIAMTLVSTGTRALYLPAMNFLHGDIGIISAEDLVLMFSKSGESEELLDLLPHIRRKGAKTVALVSNPESRLALRTDLSLCLPVEKELCPFDLAPTTSTEVQLLFGDVLAMALMQESGFGVDEYALNHPSGLIGRKISTRVRDLMKQGEEIPLCFPSDRLVDVIVELSNKKCGCLLICSPKGELLGIFTDGDLRRALQTNGAAVLEKKMEQLMTKDPLHIEAETLAIQALELMESDPKRIVTVLPVVEEGRVIGILRMHDIIQAGF